MALPLPLPVLLALRPVLLPVLLLVLLPAPAPLIHASAAQAPPPKGWLGIYSENVSELPGVEASAGGPEALRGAVSGLQVAAVFPDSPASEGGLLIGDILVGVQGIPFTMPADSARKLFQAELDRRLAGDLFRLRVIRMAVDRQVEMDGARIPPDRARGFWREPGAWIDSLESGQTLQARAFKAQRMLDLEILLGPRPEARWPAPPDNAAIYPPHRYPESAWKPALLRLAGEAGAARETQDLLQRLARCHDGADPYRLDCMTYVHRDPFRLEAVSRDILDGFDGAASMRDHLDQCAQWLASGYSIQMPRNRRLYGRMRNVPLSTTTGTARPSDTEPESDDLPSLAVPVLEQIEEALAEARFWHRQAFRNLTDQDRDFLETHRWDLSDVFAEDIYIHFDEDVDRFARNKRILDLAAKIDYPALLEAAARVALLTDPAWIDEAAGRLGRAFAGRLEEEILLERETPFGRILIAGTGRRWHRETDAAFVLDLGGDDLYTGNCGGSGGWDMPVAVCIDLSGNDAYESTLKGCQGSGVLGIGALVDLTGDDQYIGPQWCQGTGFMGLGWLHDLHGDDVYRGRTFCQGVGLFGAGLLIDESGRDRYEGDAKVQAVGLARGIGLLLDRSGDDSYYAKGLYPTGYGDAGVFDAWSQGCAIGFRTLASGGLAVLLDGGGRDRMEAGNFSQGGGYYFGLGILNARGPEGDTYIGSRYNQGFCAHQAVGVFLEEAGDDVYTTRQGVAQGLAWDECVTLFEDASGDDLYEGGLFFSHGASAHNSICVFLERGGADRYLYKPGQAKAGGNSYHGGSSLSFFVDEGGADDFYDAGNAANNAWRLQPEYGIFLDLPGTLSEVQAPASRLPLRRIRLEK